VEWVHEEPSYFQSSINIDRGFCARCGTPLTYRQPDGLEIAIGAFDDGAIWSPRFRSTISSGCHGSTRSLRSRLDDANYYTRQEHIVSFQHPDHEVENWPAHGLRVMTNLRTFYPEIEPFETGMLDVGDGHTIYWERVGTKGAKPAVFLHGGPGGGISPKQRRCSIRRFTT
jgi:hypothetical protein